MAHLYVFIECKKLEELNFLIGWKVGFSAGAVGQKVGMVLGENGSVLGKCQEGFGNRLQ